jgi:tRNA modification GTPase
VIDTIFAVSSGQPPAALVVMRISGPDAALVAERLAGGVPEPRRAVVRTLRDSADGSELDRGLVLWFPGPKTATGEDLLELHLHGGRATIAAVVRVLEQMPGLRGAEPGEFTRRALASGRIDLSEAEGLGDLLMAETEAQRRVALASAEGAVRRRVRDWQEALLGVSAQVEVLLDHADEGDVDEAALMPRIRAAIDALVSDLRAALAATPVERIRDGIRVVLAGPPNSGKSTLFNALVDRDAAIVSPIAGTTRDRIEAPVARGGVAYLLVDTAGLAEATDDPIEALGIDRSRTAIEEADILLWLGEEAPPRSDAIWVQARADEPGRAALLPGRSLLARALAAGGIDALWGALSQASGALVAVESEVALNGRQRRHVVEASDAMEHATGSRDLLVIAEELRRARLAFDRITGAAGTEAMLDALFGRFCIGK